jgi:hypothetical protein
MRPFAGLVVSLAVSRLAWAQEPEPEPAPPSEGIVVARPAAAAEPAPPTPAPEATRPASTPEPAHARPADPESELESPERRRRPVRRDVGIELDIGVNARLGDNGSYTDEQAYGANYGVGAWLAVVEQVELGLELTRTQLGRVSSDDSPNLLWAEYAVSTLWAGGRFEPWRSAEVATFVALRLGVAAQDVDARGIRAADSALAPGTTYACSEFDGPGLALGGGAGAALLLGRHVQLVARIDASAHRLEGDFLGSCAVGMGTITSVGFGLGLAYGFETGPAS